MEGNEPPIRFRGHRAFFRRLPLSRLKRRSALISLTRQDLESNKADLPKLTFFENEDGTLKAMSKTELKIALTQSDLYAAKKGIDLG